MMENVIYNVVGRDQPKVGSEFRSGSGLGLELELGLAFRFGYSSI